MKQVAVGIIGNIKEVPATSGIHFDAASRHSSNGVKVVGGVSIITLIGTPDLAKTYINMVDKLVLSGGRNVTSEFCSEEKEVNSDDYGLERDEFEFTLVKEAICQNKPIFAVCRGVQSLNIVLGGTLNQKIDNHWQDDISGTFHEVETLPDSRVSHLVKSGSRIDSSHHRSVKDLAPNLIATARDTRDGTIEAYESKHGTPILGI